MKSADIVIVGGGMVGLSLAALLAESDCQIKVIEKQPPTADLSQIGYRVSAINRHSQQILTQAGAWQRIPVNRLSPYQQMSVWEKDSFATIHFRHDDPMIAQLGLSQLGYIVENQWLQHALWESVCLQKNVEVLSATPERIGFSENGVFITLDDHSLLTAKLVVGADGANSWVRQQANIPLISRDYQHSALVCNVKTSESHMQTARQIFESESILAFLPMNDEHLCSIVWSLPPEKAQLLQKMSSEEFNKLLAIAFDQRLGLCEVQTPRDIYPLVARYARDFAMPRLALIGDAAHTIHPLAGLGVNLGFADAYELARQIQHHLKLGNDIGEYRHLRYFERVRKVEAVKLLMAMEGIKQLFSGNNPLKKLVRGIGLSLTNHNALLKKQLIKQAVDV